MSMLGANCDLPRPPLTLDVLTTLARARKFGRSGLSVEDQVFLVVADSVMKQLDGLKGQPDARAAIRKFLSHGLEECGPAGLDFLTVLGAHEGEGLALDAGALGAAGSASPFVGNKGQKVDYRIVEVAMFFQREILRSKPSATSNLSPAGEPFDLPVLLLSNDNAQISAARAHGLPAFRLASAGADMAAVLADIQTSAGQQKARVLSSGVLRHLMGSAATAGLGSSAGRSLQDQFDGAVATLRTVQRALRASHVVLSNAAAAVAGPPDGDDDGQAARRQLARVRQALQCDTGPNLADLEGLWLAVENRMAEWEGCVRVAQQPSRVLKWALPTTLQSPTRTKP
ncbi:hypothetical protein V8C86DRAFT_2612814 [Haematococcus lacustris]